MELFIIILIVGISAILFRHSRKLHDEYIKELQSEEITHDIEF
jgi:hypothetical protein